MGVVMVKVQTVDKIVIVTMILRVNETVGVAQQL